MSDQEDFFFDEEEKQAEPKKAPAPRAKAAGTTRADSAPAASFSTQSVSMTVAGLIAVCALLVGVIIGILVGGPGTEVPAPTANTGAPQQQQQAPQLSDEQLNSGELPEGHPPVGGGGSAPATGTQPAQ